MVDTDLVVDDNYDAIIVNHYRHGVGAYIPEIIAGMLEASDTLPEEGIKREIEEELGYVGGEIHQTGVSYPNPATHNNKIHSFIAFGGGCKQAQKLDEGENLHIIKLPLRDLIKKIEDSNSGVIYQSMNIAAIFFALNFIKNTRLASAQDLKKFV